MSWPKKGRRRRSKEGEEREWANSASSLVSWQRNGGKKRSSEKWGDESSCKWSFCTNIHVTEEKIQKDENPTRRRIEYVLDGR